MLVFQVLRIIRRCARLSPAARSPMVGSRIAGTCNAGSLIPKPGVSWPAIPAVLMAMALIPGARAADEELDACLKRQGSRQDIIRHCTAAAGQPGLSDTRHAAVLNQRGLTRLAEGAMAEAHQDFDDAIRLDATLASTWNSRAVLFLQQGEAARAVADEEQAVKLSPKYAFAWANLGQARLMNRDLAGALAAESEALRLAPANVELVYVGRAKAYLAQRDYAAAKADLEAALQANPRYANALSGLAVLQVCQGDFAAAAQAFRREREVRPDDESAIDLVMALQRAGQDASKELATLTRNLDEKQGIPTGLALFMEKATPEQVLGSTQDHDPWMQRQRSCRAQYQVAEWYLVHGKSGPARQALEQARQSCDPSQSSYAPAVAELSRLSGH